VWQNGKKPANAALPNGIWRKMLDLVRLQEPDRAMENVRCVQWATGAAFLIER
jgi:hypothetical protein